jgi:hypothetical protein
MKKDQTRAGRKSLAASVDKGAYENTAFGRRRVSKVPKPFRRVFWLLGVPALFIARRVRRPRVA